MKKINLTAIAIVLFAPLYLWIVLSWAMDMFPRGKTGDVIIIAPEPESIYRVEYVHDFIDGIYLLCTVCESVTTVHHDMLKSHAEEFHSDLIEEGWGVVGG